MTQADRSPADDRLKALFALDEPAARDPAFSTEVMERVMRRRFQEEVLLLSGASIVGGGALWAVWPVLQPVLVTLSQAFAPALGAAALAACAVAMLGGRGGQAPGLAS